MTFYYFKNKSVLQRKKISPTRGLGNSPTKVSINSISPGIGLVPIPTLGVNDWINAPTAALQITAPEVLTGSMSSQWSRRHLSAVCSSNRRTFCQVNTLRSVSRGAIRVSAVALPPRPSEHFDPGMKWLVIKGRDSGRNVFHLPKSGRLAHTDEREASGLTSEAALSKLAKFAHQESLYPPRD